ncbi:hypothetical protein ES288_D05G240800v1 [Gossypium darwinii]|uniref:Uncharacterized protein n=1 Tax=Gossypium darwinii TaxID=34276 RepID=A0A5D2CJ43_GOSDA|nr:hypothetical protein ES288_D05G240800v1 [Gossypium darwinii]
MELLMGYLLAFPLTTAESCTFQASVECWIRNMSNLQAALMAVL